MSFLEKLKEICDAYDSTYGSWPESKYEGEALYDFAVEKAEQKKKFSQAGEGGRVSGRKLGKDLS